MEYKVFHHRLNFKSPSGTSRGILHYKDTWILKVWESANPEIFGLGEIGPLPGLSKESILSTSQIIEIIGSKLSRWNHSELQEEDFKMMPSLKFGVETALLDLKNGGNRIFFPQGLQTLKESIPINGLIWMDKMDQMKGQVGAKLNAGFDCIKMKVGAIDFSEELAVLKLIRDLGGPDTVIRIDANGAWEYEEALSNLRQIEALNVHSVEQPLSVGDEMLPELCLSSPIPIALDEELIGSRTFEEKSELLEKSQPSYVVLKPTLLGGFREVEEWIHVAEAQDTGWWITSMLESNIGLNAISQFAAQIAPDKIHGLGTGSLYTNNFKSPLQVANGRIKYDSNKNWELGPLEA